MWRHPTPVTVCCRQPEPRAGVWLCCERWEVSSGSDLRRTWRNWGMTPTAAHLDCKEDVGWWIFCQSGEYEDRDGVPIVTHESCWALFTQWTWERLGQVTKYSGLFSKVMRGLGLEGTSGDLQVQSHSWSRITQSRVHGTLWSPCVETVRQEEPNTSLQFNTY